MKYTQSASFNPEMVDLLRRAYAEALAELETSTAPSRDFDIVATQTMLAERIIGLAAAGERSLAAMKTYALEGVRVHIASRGASL